MALFGNIGRFLTGSGWNPGWGYGLSKKIAEVGQKYRLPELNISEKFGSFQPVRVARAAEPSVQGISGTPWSPSPNDFVSGSPSYTPQTSGQSPSGGSTGSTSTSTSSSSGDSGGNDDYQNYINLLKASYGQARSDIEAQGPQLDKSYELGKGDIEGALKEAEGTATQRKEDLGVDYGEILRNQLKTYQDLGQKRYGIFSGLGTLDSSSFQEQQFRADQSLVEDRGKTEREKTRAFTEIDTKFQGYKRQADSELSRLALQYQAGKQAIASAIAQNNLEEAGAINQAIENIRARADEIRQNVANFALQAATLKKQGVDITDAIRNVTSKLYSDEVGSRLGAMRSGVDSMVPKPNTLTGQGYIASRNKGYGSTLDEYLKLAGVI